MFKKNNALNFIIILKNNVMDYKNYLIFIKYL